MKKALLTDPNSWTALIARVTLGVTIFPHGAQKLLGWFGGHGFGGTMDYFTATLGLPYIVALAIILIEFFGSLFLIVGFLTRFVSLGIFGLFIGVTTINLKNGFFMNWTGAQSGEGIEYFILLFGLAAISILLGAGKASIDRLLTKKSV